jgi:hypothetical protein
MISRAFSPLKVKVCLPRAGIWLMIAEPVPQGGIFLWTDQRLFVQPYILAQSLPSRQAGVFYSSDCDEIATAHFSSCYI